NIQKKIKKLEQKSFEQETKIDSTLEQVQENETQNDSKFEELINELQEASEFLTNLQNQNKKLSEKVQENNEQMRELLSITETYGHLPQELANQKERLESFQQVNESEYKGLVIKMEEFIQGHSATSNQLNTNYEHLLNLAEANKTDLSQLKTCISNDALSNIKEMCTDRDEHVKRIGRRLRETSDRNRKKNVNLNTKIQPNTETTSRLQVKFKSLQKKVTGNFNTTKLLIRPLKSSILEIADQFSTYKSHTQELELMKSKMTTAEGEILKLSNDHSKLLNKSPRDVMAACRLQINDSKVMNFKKETILTCFNSCLLNIGNCYNRNTGIFTAPCNGLYLCSLMLESENFVAEKFLIYDRKSDVESKRGTTHTNKTNAVACLVTVLLLNQGDEIYIKPANDIAKIKLSSSSYFLCVLLQQN
ncbi:uncharacterized protein LOC129924286, partial [Biomphalaria glabrata]|uniref:Uncharacterized protein LOC129924286 n=1 Tax=Biomphalaria glabrata TaxID=6526 RepID=A0A9W2ZHW7_BIOGL